LQGLQPRPDGPGAADGQPAATAADCSATTTGLNRSELVYPAYPPSGDVMRLSQRVVCGRVQFAQPRRGCRV